MANDIHGHDLYANTLDDNKFCREHREALRQELWDYVRESTADAVASTGSDAAAAKMYLDQIKIYDANVQYNKEQTVQYANQAKNFSDNADRKAQDVSDKLNRVISLHAEVENNTNTTTNNMNTAIQKAAEAASAAILSRSWAIGDTGTRPGEEDNCSKAYCLRAEDAYSKLIGSLKPKGHITINELKTLGDDDKVDCFMYTITDKFTTDDTFNCVADIKCFPGTVVYWKDGKWNLISNGSGSSVILDKEDNSEINISNSNKPNSASEIAVWDGDTIKAMDTKKLFQMMYPVGSIYMSTEHTNPSTFIGGTWEEWGSGRVPVGVKSDNADFDQPNQLGGSYTHNHTYNHTHTINGHDHTIAHTHTISSHDHTMSHSHTINGHSHTMAHTHTGPSHAHSMANHTHTVNNHSHTMAHTHTGPSHTHTGPSHTHSVSGGAHIDVGFTTVDGVSRTHLHIDRSGGVSNWASNVYFWLPVNTINSTSAPVQARSNAGVTGTAAAAGTGATGAAGTGNTSGSSAANTGSTSLTTNGPNIANTDSAGNGTTSGSSAANTGGSGTLTSNDSSASKTGGSGTLTTSGSSAANTGGSGTLTSNNPNNPITNNSSTVQPYVTCYMWRRTA